MRCLQFLITLFLILNLSSCSSRKINITADFDRGSIGKIVEIKPGYFEGTTRHWLKRDSIGDQYYWFYFKADHVKDARVTVKLRDMEGVYRGNPHLIYSENTQPVYSYDQEKWSRIREVSYDSAAREFTFSQDFKSEPVWIAYAHPYPYDRLLTFLSSIKSQDFVTIENIAKTKENRDIELVTITDPAVSNQSKKTIFLMAMQHSGEDAGTYFIEGMINFLLSKDKDAEKARKHFIYKLIPMMNPDGVFNGTSRYNMEMEDLNNIWLNEEKMQPEVAGVKKWAEHWYAQGQQIDMFWDVHNHTQFYTYNVLIFRDKSLDSIQTTMNRYWPVRLWHSEPQGSSHAYFHLKGIPSGSLELTQSFAEEGDYLTIVDYHNYGKSTVLGINEYFGILNE